MDEKLRKIYQRYLEADKYYVAEIAKEKFNDIFNIINDNYHDEDFSLKFAIVVATSFIVADSNLSNGEWGLFQFIMQHDFSREEVVSICEDASNDELIEIIKKISSENKILKKAILVLGICISAIDGSIDQNEHGLLQFYLDLKSSIL